MRTFLKKAGLFFLILFFLFGSIFYITNRFYPDEPKNNYMAAMIDKHAALLAAGSPKMIAAGGSNTAFSFRAELTAEAIGIPVINLGLNAGLGLNFILNELEDVAEEGDLVLLFITYFETIEGTYNLQLHTAEHYPRASRYFPLRLNQIFYEQVRVTRFRFTDIIRSIIRSRTLPTASDPDPVKFTYYTRDNFNPFGDFTGHYTLPSAELEPLLFEYRFWPGIDILNDFHQRAEERGFHLFYLFPAIPESDFHQNRSVLEQHFQDMTEYLTIPILNRPDTFVYPDSLFFDTAYHMTQKGAKKHTEEVILLLESNSEITPILSRILQKRELLYQR